jgi:hyperosmotically inducible protein
LQPGGNRTGTSCAFSARAQFIRRDHGAQSQFAALTDPAITAAVKAALLADPLSSGLKIDVDTSSAVVKLSGTVATSDEKARAEKVAKNMAGVTSVVNDLKIVPKM